MQEVLDILGYSTPLWFSVLLAITQVMTIIRAIQTVWKRIRKLLAATWRFLDNRFNKFIVRKLEALGYKRIRITDDPTVADESTDEGVITFLTD